MALVMAGGKGRVGGWQLSHPDYQHWIGVYPYIDDTVVQ